MPEDLECVESDLDEVAYALFAALRAAVAVDEAVQARWANLKAELDALRGFVLDEALADLAPGEDLDPAILKTKLDEAFRDYWDDDAMVQFWTSVRNDLDGVSRRVIEAVHTSRTWTEGANLELP